LLSQSVRGHVAHVWCRRVPVGTRVYLRVQHWLLGWAETRQFSQPESPGLAFPPGAAGLQSSP